MALDVGRTQLAPTSQVPYMLEVLYALKRQLQEEQIEAFYQRLRDEAAERRRQNPGAYVLPPGHMPWRPGEPIHQCPSCGYAYNPGTTVAP